jgi:hypothetical protein
MVDHVVVGGGRGADDGHLAGDAESAADAVDLAAVGVGAAVGGQDHLVAEARLRRQVLFMEKESFAGAAAHENSRYASLHAEPSLNGCFFKPLFKHSPFLLNAANLCFTQKIDCQFISIRKPLFCRSIWMKVTSPISITAGLLFRTGLC